MPRRGRPLTQGRWRAIALSVVLHSGIVAAAVYGWFTWKHRPPPVETLAIEAAVVDPNALKGLPAAPTPQPPKPEPEPEPEPAPPEPPPEEQGPPKPDPEEVERKKEEERLAQEKLEQEKQEQQRLDAEKKEADRLEAEKQAAAEKARQEAEKKALEKKKADEAAAKKAAEEKARLAREADLRRAMEAEERGNALRGSDEANRWHAAIVARITRAWIAPPSARAGVSCIVSVSQTTAGEVTAVRVESCSIDDAALRESVATAVNRASPLPAPPNPALFEPNLKLIFAPE
jgi:colicin import membrane protein